MNKPFLLFICSHLLMFLGIMFTPQIQKIAPSLMQLLIGHWVTFTLLWIFSWVGYLHYKLSKLENKDEHKAA